MASGLRIARRVAGVARDVAQEAADAIGIHRAEIRFLADAQHDVAEATLRALVVGGARLTAGGAAVARAGVVDALAGSSRVTRVATGAIAVGVATAARSATSAVGVQQARGQSRARNDTDNQAQRCEEVFHSCRPL